MEMIKANGFSEMTADDLSEVNGGLWWQIALGVFAVAAGYNELYTLGKTVGSWFRE